MKRIIVLAGLAAVLAWPASSWATAPTWPARCSTFLCVNNHLNQQHKTQAASVAALRAQIAALKKTVAGLQAKVACYSTRSVTEYGDPIVGDWGFVYYDGAGATAFKAPALDWTVPGQLGGFDTVSVVTSSC